MKAKFKLKISVNKSKDNKHPKIYNFKYILIIIIVLAISVSLLHQGDIFINMPIIGNDSNNSNIDINISGTTVENLSTDEPTATPDN